MSKNPTTEKGKLRKFYSNLSIKQLVYLRRKYKIIGLKEFLKNFTTEIKKDILINGNTCL